LSLSIAVYQAIKQSSNQAIKQSSKGSDSLIFQLYSFQKGPRAQELKQSHADALITDIGAQCKDFGDTAAALMQMDMLISVDTSVVHLAASLGKPVINLLNTVPYWLYGIEGEKTPWYPSMALLRQQERGQWGEVFEQLIERL